MSPSPKDLLWQSQIVPFLKRHGFDTGFSESTVSKLCAAGKGPRVDFWVGKRALRKPETVLKWARDRIRPADQPAKRYA